MKKKITVKEMAMTGVLAALVYAASAFLQIPIPTAIDNTRIHMGNVMCLLSGLLLGPLWGGFAAGFGSMFFDLTNPLYTASAPFTFAFKFAMAWLCGKIAWGNGADAKKIFRNITGATCGAVLYVILYLSKGYIENYYIMRMQLTPVLISLSQKAIVSTVNAVIAVIVAVPLAKAVRMALSRANLMQETERQAL